MSVNLIEMAKGLFSADTISAMAGTLQENDSSISKTLDAYIPAVFKGLADKSSTIEGAQMLAKQAEEQSEHNVFDNVMGRLGDNQESGFLNLSQGLFTNIFGGPATGMVNAASNFSGVKASSASSILSLAVPAIMSFLGNFLKNNKESATDFASLLQSQKEHIAAAMPAGFNPTHLFESNDPQTVAPVAAPQVANHQAAPMAAAALAPNYSDNDEEEKSSGLGWLLPILLMVLLGAAALYFFKPSNDEAAASHNHTDNSAATTAPDSTNHQTATATKVGGLDSSGNFVYELGNMVTLNLPGNAGSLTVGENSTEAKLMAFLQSNQAVDTVKGNWFEFTNVRFNTGKSTITEESLVQLNNMVTIAKAFSTAKFKIGGYTDNTGSAQGNLSLSKSRAAAVAAKLKEMGMASESLTGSEGYGAQFPIGDNSTAEGRAQNRRVSVNVKAK